jgi:hypothetical protein
VPLPPAARAFEELTRNGECLLEIRLRLRRIRLLRLQRDFAGHAIDFGFEPPVLGCFHRGYRFANAAPGVIELTEFHTSPGQI